MPPHFFLLAVAAGVAIGLASPVSAQSPAASATAAYVQVPDTYRFPLGDLEITALSDGTVPQDLHQLLTQITPAEVDKLLDRSFLTNPVEASINVYLIEDGARRILVDTGSGELFGAGNGGKLLDSLAAAGTEPEEITDILITHIHGDHSGGLAVGGKILFPHATVHVGKPDLDFFLDPANAERSGYDRHYFDEAARTIGLYEMAGQVKPFSGNAAILPGITATLHPGHTPGSAFFTVESKGKSIVFVGDIIHVAAVQFPDPDVTIVYDVDPKRAAKVRATAFPRFVEERQLVAAPHLPFPGVGHIRAEGNGQFSWQPVEYRNRAGQ